MIARIWHGRTTPQKADVYLTYLRETGIKDYKSTRGNKDVIILRKVTKKYADFLLITIWDSFASIRAFAGKEVEKAVYYPKDSEFLLELEPNVAHYEVMSIGDPVSSD